MLTFIELSIVAFGLWFMVTQIIVPGWLGLPLVPFFRLRKLSTDVDSAREEVLASHLSKEADQIRATIIRTNTETKETK